MRKFIFSDLDSGRALKSSSTSPEAYHNTTDSNSMSREFGTKRERRGIKGFMRVSLSDIFTIILARTCVSMCVRV